VENHGFWGQCVSFSLIDEGSGFLVFLFFLFLFLHIAVFPQNFKPIHSDLAMSPRNQMIDYNRTPVINLSKIAHHVGTDRLLQACQELQSGLKNPEELFLPSF